MASAQNAIYDPLPIRPHLREARLILLQPGQWNGNIDCKLVVIALGEKSEFEAVLYVWGSGNDIQEVLLNGHGLQVNANLESALRYFQCTTEVRVLWADGIFINNTEG